MSDFTDKILEKRLSDKQRAQVKARHSEVITSLKGILGKDAPTELSVKNLPKDYASSKDIARLIDTLEETLLTQFVIFMANSEQQERLISKLDILVSKGKTPTDETENG